jgi:hypothetical protein
MNIGVNKFMREKDQSHLFLNPFLYQQFNKVLIQKPSLKLKRASNAGVDAWWLGKTP